ncbi:MAG: hypothetical protein AAFO68_04290 [Pseudomonadota bacterium]
MHKLARKGMFVALIVSLGALSACGRMGDPIKPSQAAINEAKANKQPAPKKPVPNEQNPEKRFVLDGLLE